jgi:hypothetical protein
MSAVGECDAARVRRSIDWFCLGVWCQSESLKMPLPFHQFFEYGGDKTSRFFRKSHLIISLTGRTIAMETNFIGALFDLPIARLARPVMRFGMSFGIATREMTEIRDSQNIYSPRQILQSSGSA